MYQGTQPHRGQIVANSGSKQLMQVKPRDRFKVLGGDLFVLGGGGKFNEIQ